MMSRKTLVNIFWYLVILSIGTNYFSVDIFSLEIASIAGCLVIFSDRNLQITSSDIRNLVFMSLFSFGIFISRLIYTPDLSQIINILFLVKISFFFLFIYFYITKYSVPPKTLYLVAFFVIPHFMAYLSGEVPTIRGQFPGLHGDPNYTSADYISSFLASIIIVGDKKKSNKVRSTFLIVLAISIFMVIISASRTALLSCIIISLLYFLLKLKVSIYELPKQLAFIFLIAVSGIIFFFEFQEILVNTKIYNRLFESEGGASLVENERYLVWIMAFNLIQENGLFQGYGGDQFLAKIYRFGPHNSWLDIGIRMGSYTFYSYLILTILGFFKIFKIIQTQRKELRKNSIKSFLVLYPIGVAVMLFSISVSFQYHYCFVMFLLFLFFTNKIKIKDKHIYQTNNLLRE